MVGASTANDATGFGGIINYGTISIGDGRTLGAQTITNYNLLEVGADATVRVTTNQLSNNGTINVADGGSIDTEGGFLNLAGSILNFNGTGSLTANAGSAEILNRGEFNVLGGEVTVTGNNFNNEKTLKLTGGDVSGIGTLTNTATGTVQVNAGRTLSLGTFTSTAGGSATGSGTIIASTSINLGAGSYST
ncbi:hypothetical protein AB4144_40180, partial [Rhizobiaceae sp. 2RAB30]